MLGKPEKTPPAKSKKGKGIKTHWGGRKGTGRGFRRKKEREGAEPPREIRRGAPGIQRGEENV